MKRINEIIIRWRSKKDASPIFLNNRNLFSEQYEVSHEDCVKEAFGKFNVVGVRILTLVTKLGNEKEFHPFGKQVEIKDNDDVFYVNYPDK